ncbi:MAG TPA: S24/S26 family peptidase [Candidatus Binatia bacterium]|nr:S24/S26 family peptidase [Candidatus Binatia bacterium]
MAIATPGRHAAASDFLPDMLARRGEAWVREASASMAPIIRPGDRLLLRPLPGRPAPGAVLVYRTRDRWMVHRLVASDGRHLLLKGDDADSVERVRPGDVLARVVAVRRPSGRTTRFDRFPWPWVEPVLARASRRSAVGAGRLGRAAWRLVLRLVGGIVR